MAGSSSSSSAPRTVSVRRIKKEEPKEPTKAKDAGKKPTPKKKSVVVGKKDDVQVLSRFNMLKQRLTVSRKQCVVELL